MRERRQVGEPVHPELESKTPRSRQGLRRCLPTGPTNTGDEQLRTFLARRDLSMKPQVGYPACISTLDLSQIEAKLLLAGI